MIERLRERKFTKLTNAKLLAKAKQFLPKVGKFSKRDMVDIMVINKEIQKRKLRRL
jgi:hypothetical protein